MNNHAPPVLSLFFFMAASLGCFSNMVCMGGGHIAVISSLAPARTPLVVVESLINVFNVVLITKEQPVCMSVWI